MSFRGLSESDRIRRIKDAALYSNFVNILNTQPNCIAVDCVNYGDCIVRYPTYEYRQNVKDGAKECDNCDCFITSTVTSSISAFGYPWTTVTGLPSLWRQIIYAGGQFIAVGWAGGQFIMTSPDGINWTAATLTPTPLISVGYGNGRYVASGPSGYVLYSADGASWTRQQLLLGAGAFFNGVAYGNGTFVIVGYDAITLVSYVYTTPDGILLSPQLAQSGKWNSVAYGNNIFVAVGEAGAIMTSPDGLSWTLQTSPNLNDWFRIRFLNNMFIAVSTSSGGGDSIITSSDGVTWTSYAFSNGAYDIAYSGGSYVIVGSATISTSTDLITWTQRYFSLGNSWNSVVYGANKFVAVDGDSSSPYVAYAP
jgi:hypothetical protein